MIRKLYLCLCCILLTACQASHGSFEDGDKELSYVFTCIENKIQNKTLQMPLLNQQMLSGIEVEEGYALDLTKVDDYMVKTAVVEAQIGEIALFKVKDEYVDVVKEAISYRKEKLKETWGNYVKQADTIINQAQEGKIGQYYYFVVGSDSEKVVNYMKKLDA